MASDHMLTSELVLREVYDPISNSLKTIPAGDTSFAVELDADDGDSVISRAESLSVKASISNSDSGVILPETSSYGLKTITLYTKTTSIIVNPQVCTLEVSPSDSDDVWISSNLTITPSTSLDVVVMSSPISILARRIRVTMSTPITSGTCDLYVVGQSI